VILNPHADPDRHQKLIGGGNHSLNGMVQTVLTATFNSYANKQILTSPNKIDTPGPINNRFGTVDYVHENTPYTKFGTNPPTEGFFFSLTRLQVRPVGGFLCAIA